MNPVTTALTLNMQLPNIATVSWAVQGDTLSRQIEATLVDGSTAWNPQTGYIGVIRFFKPDGTNGVYDTDEGGNPAVTWTGNIATIRIAQQCLAVPGTVMMDLEFYDANAARVSAFGWAMNVQPSAVTDNEFLSSDYYNILEKQIAGVLGAAGHAPYINDTTKNWMIWDDNAGDYVDSGYSSVGEQGPQGPQGVSIISTTKDSGTGAPGTTDVYDVNLSNGTVAGQFSVYNGSDGQGSPGSQLPIMDGIAAVGSAIAYSREDHVHPSDTSKADQVVIAGVEASTTATNSYAIGEYLILNGALYRVTVAITAGDTITDTGGSANVEAVTVGSELSGLKNTLNQLDQNMAYVESGNTASRTYTTGAYISWKGTLYKANTAIPQGTAFSSGSGGNLSDLVDGNGALCGGLNNLKNSLFEMVTASWLATSSNAAHTQLTNKLSLTAGKWVINIRYPTVTVAAPPVDALRTNAVSVIDNMYFNRVSYSNYTVIINLQTNDDVWLRSGGSATTTFSELERGGLTAVKLG